MFKKTEVKGQKKPPTPSARLFSHKRNPGFQRILDANALDNRARQLVSELDKQHPLRMQFDALPRKKISKNAENFELFEKELQRLIVLLQAEMDSPSVRCQR